MYRKREESTTEPAKNSQIHASDTYLNNGKTDTVENVPVASTTYYKPKPAPNANEKTTLNQLVTAMIEKEKKGTKKKENILDNFLNDNSLLRQKRDLRERAEVRNKMALLAERNRRYQRVFMITTARSLREYIRNHEDISQMLYPLPPTQMARDSDTEEGSYTDPNDDDVGEIEIPEVQSWMDPNDDDVSEISEAESRAIEKVADKSEGIVINEPSGSSLYSSKEDAVSIDEKSAGGNLRSVLNLGGSDSGTKFVSFSALGPENHYEESRTDALVRDAEQLLTETRQTKFKNLDKVADIAASFSGSVFHLKPNSENKQEDSDQDKNPGHIGLGGRETDAILQVSEQNLTGSKIKFSDFKIECSADEEIDTPVRQAEQHSTGNKLKFENLAEVADSSVCDQTKQDKLTITAQNKMRFGEKEIGPEKNESVARPATPGCAAAKKQSLDERLATRLPLNEKQARERWKKEKTLPIRWQKQKNWKVIVPVAKTKKKP